MHFIVIMIRQDPVKFIYYCRLTLLFIMPSLPNSVGKGVIFLGCLLHSFIHSFDRPFIWTDLVLYVVV